ncbi:putative esterase [Gordonia bronchialis DSM 43247]|uniref:Esterase n=1 Tax=Gordonia bronchialis (strain ATCC 25592 / DSM 43247 / BCRC 13721 / JCM 3198 / KCTC 3076 / NBRC 16047 / NCTC 10667) TaxID=526226 RepID=D0L786_GORB4|nr:alpha/beta hydrolase family protein [Gordonia bronchialis]ACY20871.1 putative esterase [Gordonia bronchialis DSM 43247]MCC3323646.1 esterase family protein [Gordonia bronchialis]QGS25395.1 esterase family protein [Gordonia bronchialis]STQ63710.1 Mycolyl transferase 85A [Gordonia bronchialis]
MSSTTLSPRGRIITGVSVVAILTLALFAASSLFSATNPARALAGHPDILRPGCTWDKSGNYVQNCKVWSKSQNKYVIVQIRASNGSNQGIYLLDGMRAGEDRSAWTTDVQAAKVYDGRTDTTLVMPVGGASSFYTDWDGGAGGDNKTIKQETFLTSELPDYLQENFGVSPNNNAIVGLSMSGGPAVTLAERHPEQFKVVQAMSGYYQTDNPIGYAGVFASQTMVSNYTNGILNMWGTPGSQRWADNDPSKNVAKLKENGQVLIISSGNGFLTASEMKKLSPQDQISAIALEILSAVSTVLFQMQAAQSGASVISLPNYGGHTWENWGRALADGKPHVLEALRNNPPVTTKTQVVSAEGTPDPQGSVKATVAAQKAAAMSPVLDPAVLAADQTSTTETSTTDSSSTESSATEPSATEPSATEPSTTGSATESATPDLTNKVTGTEVPRVPDTTSETAPSATTEEPAPSTDVTPEVTAPTTTTTTPVPTA